MNRLIIYDTSNFINFPIGGQLTSLRNFLHYMCECQSQRVKDILLIGTTVKEEQLGMIQNVEMYGHNISFLAVTLAEKNLNNPGKSLRLQFVKGLLRYRKVMKINKSDCNYIHTPEAYGIVKILCPGSKCVIFSHGSYFNMEKGFRFFQKNFLIKKGFNLYLKWIIRNANLIFILDKDSEREYGKYNKNLIKVKNSILYPTTIFKETHEGKNILFVGRLSKDKRIEPIIQAIMKLGQEYHMTIVGSGEEFESLVKYQNERICFVGAVEPEQVGDYMCLADILVLNSAFEGIPMTILEGLSYGLPVISTNVGGIGEVLSFGLDSEETDGTAEEIKKAILKIEEDYEKYANFARKNAGKFDYKIINKEIYQHLNQYWKETE